MRQWGDDRDVDAIPGVMEVREPVDAARQAMAPNFRQERPAARYRA